MPRNIANFIMDFAPTWSNLALTEKRLPNQARIINDLGRDVDIVGIQFNYVISNPAAAGKAIIDVAVGSQANFDLETTLFLWKMIMSQSADVHNPLNQFIGDMDKTLFTFKAFKGVVSQGAAGEIQGTQVGQLFANVRALTTIVSALVGDHRCTIVLFYNK